MSSRAQKKPKGAKARTKAASRPLPAALAKTAKAAHAARMQRLATQGYEALAIIRERQTDVASNMFDIGVALVTLKGDGIAEALGRKGFADIVTRDLRMALTTANALVALATRVPRDVVRSIGPGRSAALLELADATDDDTAPAQLLNAKIKLPSGSTLDVAKATDQEIRDGAREIRAARPAAKAKRGRGFTTSPEAKARYAGFEKGLRQHAKGLELKTKLVATRDARGPRLRIEGRFDELASILEALRRALGA